MHPLYGALPEHHNGALYGACYTRYCDCTSLHVCASSLQSFAAPQDFSSPVSIHVFVFGQFSEQLWLFNGQVEDSTAGDFFYPLNGTEHGSQPSLTTRDRELVSVLEVRIEPGDLNRRPLTLQSVTLPTLPRVMPMWNDLIYVDLNDLAGAMPFYWTSCLLPFVHYWFLFLFFHSMGWYCGPGVFGLIGC